MKLIEELVKNYTERDGLIEILTYVGYEDFSELCFTVPLTLRRAELLVFLNSKIDMAVNAGNYRQAYEIDLVKQFYSNDYTRAFQTEYGVSLMSPSFFKENIMFMLTLLREFDMTDTLDRESEVILPYNEMELSNFLPILYLVKKDEILWGWNKHQFRNSDLLTILAKGCVLKLKSSEISTGPECLNALINNKELRTSMIFIIIEAMAYHETGIKGIIEELEDNLPGFSFKFAIKEVAVLEPRIHFIYPM